MPFFLSPIANDQIFDSAGDPLVGGQVETYLAGSSTPAATYTSDTGLVQNGNPIILNSLGYAPNAVWLSSGVTYKIIIKNADGAVLRTIDNVAGINDASVSQSEWVQSGLTPTYISATSFSLVGDQTAIFQVGRRLQTLNTSGLVYSTISNSVFAAGITTVTLTNDSTTLDPGLSGVSYALLAASPLSVPNLPFSKITGVVPVSQGGAGTGLRADIASAATVDITAGAPNTNQINITGTTTITAFTVAAGRLLFVRFAGSLTLTNNANIVTQAGANIVTQANDTCILRATAANVVEVLAYTRAYSGTAPIRVYQGNLSGAAIRELTGIPSWARKIVVEYWLASTNGASAVPGVEIGPSGYGGTGGSVTSQVLNANQTLVTSIGSPIPLLSTAWAADTVVYGKVDFEYVGNNGSNELWSGTLQGIRADVASAISSRANISFASGVFPDRVRMTTRSVDQWDAGVWAVSIFQ